jgi:NET1-associated nuclear protein 1 (U3 small nucleolar RNA-associated protein 17)
MSHSLGKMVGMSLLQTIELSFCGIWLRSVVCSIFMFLKDVLIPLSVSWQHFVSRTISHIISHPRENTFIVMYDSKHSSSTALRKFSATSANPMFSRTLPFKLRKVVWYPYKSTGEDFTLVGITHKWSSVVLGDRVNLPQADSSSAREISGDNSPYQKNLFQDIFGVSAFQNTSQPVVTTSYTRDEPSAHLLKFRNPLETPAYLLPPLHTLFDPLVDCLLQKRDVRPLSEAQYDNEQVDEEDVTMEDAPPLRARAARVLLDDEMDGFVELFKQQTFCKFYSITLPALAHVALFQHRLGAA